MIIIIIIMIIIIIITLNSSNNNGHIYIYESHILNDEVKHKVTGSSLLECCLMFPSFGTH